MDTLRLGYQGWSGFVLRGPADGAQSVLAFDPCPKHALGSAGLVLLLTHGHPEHVQGALAHLRRAHRASATVVASSRLCRWLERAARRSDRFVPVQPGDRVEVNGWAVRAFEWEHMSLLPPGALPAARYVLTLVRHPRGLAKIALGGITGPPHGPMLGYAVRPIGGGGALVYYGEGVHRRTTRAQLRAALGDEPVDTLVFGAEPEDAHVLPALLADHPVKRVVVFEPHRPWRAEFSLPQLDVADLGARLRAARLDARALTAGDTIGV